MHTFKDSLGRVWEIEINVTTIRRVRGLAGVDLLEMAGGTLATRLASDPLLLADVLFAAVELQAKSAGVSKEAFEEALDGDAVNAGADALVEELIGFFPASRRILFQTLIKKSRTVMEEMEKQAQKEAESPEMDEAIKSILTPPESGASSSSAPASSA